MTEYRIHRAAPADATTIRDLVRAAYARWVQVLGREPRPMTIDYAQAVLQHDFDLLHAPELIGLIETERRDGYLWIENIALHPDWQGRGLGRQLLDHADRLARDAGFKEIRLLTNGVMLSNIRLYQRCGYGITGVEPYAGGEVVHMQRSLA